MSPVRVLITGGAGFIGSNLARVALAEGHEVVVLDDLSTGYAANLAGLDVRFHEGSVNEPRLLQAALDGVDSVVHLAALGSVPRSILDPVATHEANATGTLNILEGARRAGVHHVLMSSSSSVYGLNPALPKGEREWVRPLSPYAVSKLAGEQYLLAYQQSFGLTTLAFRFFNVYGPRQMPGHAYAAVVPVFLDAMLRGEPVPVHGDGLQSRDFTYVGTVCAVLLDAVARRVTHPEPVNLAFGTNTTITALVRELEDVTGLPADVVHQPPRPGDVRASQADNRVLRSLFPSVEPVPLRNGLIETLAWFKERS
jgi:UDP-glucose 4-epimerase